VTLFESSAEIGGQFTLAREVPGKQEYQRTIDYYATMIAKLGVELKLKNPLSADQTDWHSMVQNFDEIIISTGVRPSQPAIPGIEKALVKNYVEVLSGRAAVGKKIVIIGAGGIGFDVATYVFGPGLQEPEKWLAYWGIHSNFETRGALVPAVMPIPDTRVVLMQRSVGQLGRTLGKTTGWSHRLHLKKHGLEMLGGVTYQQILDNGLWIEVYGERKFIEADTIVICAGQQEENSLYTHICENVPALKAHIVGGALQAAELDAQRAIAQGAALAAQL
jgi:2,4-dienoyl-CoA reductase (NADPH2)